MIPETKTVSAVLLDREGREIFRKDNVEVPIDWQPTAINIVSDKYLKKQESSVPVAYADISNTIFDKDPNFVEQHFPGIRSHLLDLMLNQMALFNSPVEFNFRPDSTHLQGSACFIFNIDDDMEHILSRTTDEARVYVYGSGHGSNYSKLREEDAPLSGGGKASGPLSFMIPGNAFAKTIKAGGKTRRAAKIVILDISHPDVEKFIDEKWHEENKAKHLINADPSLGVGGIESEAYNTVNGQNANYSVRLSDEFMRAVEDDKDWALQSVLDPPPEGYDKVRKILPARQLFRQIATRAHQCGDPGLQFGTTVNKANPLYPEIEILGSNPCFTGDTLVRTRRMGICPIKDLRGNSDMMVHQTGMTEAKFFKTGDREVIRVALSGGIHLDCTPDHRWFVEGEGWVEAQNLLGKAIRFDTSGRTTPTSFKEEAVIAGFLLGDGVYHNTNTSEAIDIKFSVKDTEVMDLIQKYLPSKPVKKNYSSTKLLQVFRDYRIDELPNHLRTFPYGKATQSVPHLRSFLKGFFSANGSVVVTDNYARVTLKSINKHIIDETQKLLASLGIKSYITTNKERQNVFYNGTYTMKPSYDLNITGSHALHFYNTIGFIQTYKMDKLSIITEQTTFIDKKMKVKSIKTLGVKPVYDFTIIDKKKDPHGIICGCKVHNCGEFYGVPDSACNLATINILKFIEKDGSVNWDALGKAVETLIVAMDIIATIGWYPYEEMRVNTDLYRPLGLNITNFAASLMFKGMRYGSPESVRFAEKVMNFITQRAWDTSSKLSTYIGTHLEPYRNRMEDAIIYQNCVLNGPTPRNTQVTLIAPTGTVSFAMGADTTSIEPFFSLVSYKSMIGGGFLEIVPEIISTSLKRLGYDPIKGVAYIKENGNLKGFVSEDHEPIFHTAMDGLTYEDHLAIQAAFQKHISGGISKTVNLPPDITVDEIENIYMKAWKIGLKGITVYRDGSKIFQPLSAKADKEEENSEPGVTLAQPYRVKPQDERLSITKKMTINGLEGYVTTGLYHNGEICEIFVELSKSGSTLNGFVNALCTFISIGIQHGVPLQVFIDKMEYTSFEPAGLANLDKEGHFMVSSILDYLAKYLKDLVERPEEHLHRLVDIHSKDEADDCDEDDETPSCEEPPRKESRPSNLLSNNYGTCDSCGNVSIKDGACFTCTVCGTNTGCG